jgi:hypothetical protein
MQRPQGVRYRAKMKKSIRKLVLRNETIRELGTLQLERVSGGFDSGINCPAQAVIVVPPPRGG